MNDDLLRGITGIPKGGATDEVVDDQIGFLVDDNAVCAEDAMLLESWQLIHILKTVISPRQAFPGVTEQDAAVRVNA